MKLRPAVEQFEARQLLSVGAHASHVTHVETRSLPAVHHADQTPASPGAASDSATKDAAGSATAARHPGRQLAKRFLGYRITNPTKFDVNLIPPFGQVLVQNKQPVPGQVYNVLYVAVKNVTSQTFTASNNFLVRFPNRTDAPTFPVLTGNQEWLPSHWMVFYVLTKQYYPLTQLQGGFQFEWGGRITTLVPGPSAIFLRVKYNPAGFHRFLNWNVAFGQGAQFGRGAALGIADTAINTIASARATRIDFGGHF